MTSETANDVKDKIVDKNSSRRRSDNCSFDVSAQFDEIFAVEQNQVQARISPQPPTNEIESEKKKKNESIEDIIFSDEDIPISEVIKRDQVEEVAFTKTKLPECQEVPSGANKEATMFVTTPILKSRTPIVGKSSEKTNKRVSWVDQKIDDLGCSPPKLVRKEEIIEKDVKADEDDVRAANEDADESSDVFGDTFENMDFAELSLAEANEAGRRHHNVNNKSCPKTPNFAACSEELILEESEQVGYTFKIYGSKKNMYI